MRSGRWWHRPGARILLADAGWAVAVAGVLLPWTVMSLADIRQPAGWAATVVAAVATLHASLVLRRRNPLAGYAVACLAMLALVLAPFGEIMDHPSGGMPRLPMLFVPSSATFLPVLYSACAGARRRLPVVAALVVAAAGVGLAAVRIGRVTPPGYPVWQYRVYLTLALLLAVTAAWGLGLSRMVLVRREAERRTEATAAATRAERSRIARDMHDVVAHSLAVIVRQAEGGAMVATRAPDRAVTVLQAIADVGRGALDDMRGLLGVLRGPDPGPDSVPAPGRRRDDPDTEVPASLVDLLPTLERARGAGLGVAATEYGERYDLGRAGELAVHHLIQEALTNTIKHVGPGAHARIVLDWLPTALVVEVHDDGGVRGGQHPPVPGSGAGLRGLGERISAVGGGLAAGPRDGGFAVRAVLPRRGGTRGAGERA